MLIALGPLEFREFIVGSCRAVNANMMRKKLGKTRVDV
jgi:hypothetical protein